MRFIYTILCCLLAVQSFSQYQVGQFSKTFFDSNRNRDIDTEVFYPTDNQGNPVTNETFPVLVFGHGFVMIYSAYENIWQELVPRGYIIAFPRTEGAIFPTPDHEEFGNDLAFLVDALQLENNDQQSPLLGIVAPETAILGHSMGGGCTFLAAENNANIQTIIGMAPAETNPSAIAAAAQVSVPTLVLSGEQDGVTPPIDNHIPMYDDANTNTKIFVNILGGAHCYFANSNFNCDFGETTSSTGISISRTEQQQLTYNWLNPWLDYHLKGDCSAWASITDSLLMGANGVTTQYLAALNPMPDLQANGNDLYTMMSGNSYAWAFDGSPITMAMDSSYTATQSGIYTLTVTYDNGCSRMVDYTHTAIPTNIEVPTHHEIDLYYNQNNIYWSGLQYDAQLELFDIYGRLIQQHTISSYQNELALHGLVEGYYVVRISDVMGNSYQLAFVKK